MSSLLLLIAALFMIKVFVDGVRSLKDFEYEENKSSKPYKSYIREALEAQTMRHNSIAQAVYNKEDSARIKELIEDDRRESELFRETLKKYPGLF
jgi:phosphopantetheine adenylyltransferase